MNRRAGKPNNWIEQAVSEIRQTPISDEQVRQASSRVLATLTAEHNKVIPYPSASEAKNGERIQGCADFQALIPAYLSSSLTISRKLLFEDHTAGCVACRKALNTARGHGTPSAPALRFKTSSRSMWRPLAAAAVILIVAISQRNAIRDFIWPIDVHAVTQTVNGGFFRVSGQEIRAIAAGERIERDQSVRTGTDSGAVLELADGSKIEMNARSEIALDRARDGVQIQLHRGSVIVTAARQRSGHLYVATPDCSVSVVGTVFSVNAGTKGSRVSVIEGEVHVQQGSESTALHPGQQIATNIAMGTIPLEQEIAWSRDRDLHLALLKEVVAFSQDLGQRLGAQEMRHTSNLVSLVPVNTLILASLPNVAQPLAQSYAAMKQRISENPTLQQWWGLNIAHSDGRLTLDDMMNRVTTIGSYLGPELVIALSNREGHPSPLLLADISRFSDLDAALRSQLDQGGSDFALRIAHEAADLAKIPDNGSTLVVYADQSLLAVAASARVLEGVLERRRQPSSDGFVTSALYQRVSQAYEEGVGWLLAADLHQLVTGGNTQASPDLIGDVQQLVVEQKTGSGGASYRAVLGFNQARSGIAAWLAPAGPVGATEFLSPNTYGAAAVIMKDPALIFDDVFAMLQKDTNALRDLQQFQQEHRLDVRYDLALPLGNELLVAVDGPILPTPSWKLVIEVNDAAKLQNTLQWVVSEVNREAAANNKPTLNMATEVSGGRTFYTLTAADLPVEVHYTYWAGYLIIAPTRVLLEQAIQYHDTGNSLARSDYFRSQLPADGRDNASGFVYQNLQAVANAIPVPGVRETVAGAFPTLVCLYGEPDRITMSSKGVLGTNIASMAGLGGMMQAIGIH